MQLCGSLSILWHCLSLGLEGKLTFSSPVATAEFSKFAGMLSAALTASSFRIWNSSTGIPSPPLALFVVMLSKEHYVLPPIHFSFLDEDSFLHLKRFAVCVSHLDISTAILLTLFIWPYTHIPFQFQNVLPVSRERDTLHELPKRRWKPSLGIWSNI